jgi:hypothetical protein
MAVFTLKYPFQVFCVFCVSHYYDVFYVSSCFDGLIQKNHYGNSYSCSFKDVEAVYVDFLYVVCSSVSNSVMCCSLLLSTNYYYINDHIAFLRILVQIWQKNP